jgi:hypothetical protein
MVFLVDLILAYKFRLFKEFNFKDDNEFTFEIRKMFENVIFKIIILK